MSVFEKLYLGQFEVLIAESQRALLAAIAGVTDKESFWHGGGDLISLNWMSGHVLYRRESVLSHFGHSLTLSSEQLVIYSTFPKSKINPALCVPIRVISERLRLTYETIKEEVESIRSKPRNNMDELSEPEPLKDEYLVLTSLLGELHLSRRLLQLRGRALACSGGAEHQSQFEPQFRVERLGAMNSSSYANDSEGFGIPQKEVGLIETLRGHHEQKPT